jgi:hypothetical protein
LNLKVTNQTVNAYKLKIYSYGKSGLGLFGLTRDGIKIIKFTDHSMEFQPSKVHGSRKRPREISLPNPKFLAIHAAIAGILHTSGAGEFLDELFEKYRLDEIDGPVTWENFEDCVKLTEIRETLKLPLITTN